MQKIIWRREIALGGGRWGRSMGAPVPRPRALPAAPTRQSARERASRTCVGVSGGVRRRCPEDGVALGAARAAELDARGRSERQLRAGAPRRAPPAALGASAQGRPGIGQPLHHR